MMPVLKGRVNEDLSGWRRGARPLTGLPVQDIDYVVVGSTPEACWLPIYKPVGKDFPVFLHPRSHEEYALARTEEKPLPVTKVLRFTPMHQ
jgi:hypothetical protein